MKLIGEKIKAARMERGLTQVQLAKMIGEKTGTVINNWESANSRPAIDKIPSICQALHITPDYLFNITGEHPSVDEMSMVKKYRKLDSFGKSAVDAVLNVEFDRMLSIQPKKQRARMLKFDFYNYPASAGTGNFLETETPEDIWVKEVAEAEDADYVIPITGDSMEPTYHGGDKVFVEKCSTIEVGEIGIFVVNGEAYIKELGEKCLISHNSAYKPIKLTANDSVYCCGRVLGVVEE